MKDIIPKISIITAVYNNKKYIRKAVESVFRQDFEDFEYIIVDDGSNDGTEFLVEEIAKEDDRIRVIHQKNQWIYAAFNKGIDEAKGEYVYILNSDDQLTQNSLTYIQNAIQKYNHPDIIWTKVSVCKCNDEQRILDKKDMNPLVKNEIFWDKNVDIKTWEILFISNIIGNQANAYKRDFISNIRFKTDVFGADYLFNIDALKNVSSYVMIPQEVYLFFDYSNEKMNASIGKYYGYEHDMYNEYYRQGMELIERRAAGSERMKELIKNRRKKDYSVEIKSLLLYGKKDVDEKFDDILCKSWDEILLESFEDREELDSRILNVLRECYTNYVIPITEKYRFMYDMLECLLRYEKDASDIEKLKKSIYNESNPNRVGELFYRKLQANIHDE